jgi:hypothetical protein
VTPNNTFNAIVRVPPLGIRGSFVSFASQDTIILLDNPKKSPECGTAIAVTWVGFAVEGTIPAPTNRRMIPTTRHLPLIGFLRITFYSLVKE